MRAPGHAGEVGAPGERAHQKSPSNDARIVLLLPTATNTEPLKVTSWIWDVVPDVAVIQLVPPLVETSTTPCRPTAMKRPQPKATALRTFVTPEVRAVQTWPLVVVWIDPFVPTLTKVFEPKATPCCGALRICTIQLLPFIEKPA